MLDLHRLNLLRRFAVHGSISATAEALGYSPSAVSQQLATLEREVGIALIERTAQRASLTDAGRDLVRHAVIILDAAETAESSLRARVGTVAGHVDVGCIPGLAADLAPQLVALQRAHPALSVTARETVSTAAAGAVLDGDVDLAVVDDWGTPSRLPASGLTVYHLRRDPVVLALPAAHPMADRSGPVSAARLRDLLSHETWLCAPRGQHSRVAGDLRLSQLGITPSHRWEFEGLHVLASVAASGAGVTLLPLPVAAGDPRLVTRPLTPRMSRTVVALSRSSREADPALAACLAACLRAFAKRAPRA